ncbi:MAG: ABC transporter substrate-binding protein [Crocosphaera sp.]|nr:ABC transporter substrate-binding protein [Crocosphaera sp.]
MKKPPKKLIKFFSIIGIIAIVIVLWELFCRNIILPIVAPNDPNDLNNLNQIIPLENRFSVGERRLFYEVNIQNGIEAFNQKKYDDAEEYFREAVEANRSDPEVQIYLNNSQARQQHQEPFVLATVVPMDTKENNAKAILRGIADAQTKFNDNNGLNNRLLEIMIVNDSNKPEISQQVAQRLANNPSVLGVIGHNSSSSTKAALPEYTQANLPVISSTSTATDLSSYIFFRTVPSNEKLASCLADYAFNNDLKELAIFYTEKAGLNIDAVSAYSVTIKDDFAENFRGSIERNNLIDMSDPSFNPEDKVQSLINKVDAVVFFPSTDEEIIKIFLEVAKANKELPQPFQLLGGDTIYNPEVLIDGDKVVEKLILAVPWFADKNYSYTERAEKRWGGQVSWRTATSYDSTQAFIHALSPNATRETILNNLRQTNLLKDKTSGEPLRFFGDGDRNTPPILVQVVQGTKNAPAGSNYTFASVDYECE